VRADGGFLVVALGLMFKRRPGFDAVFSTSLTPRPMS